MVIMRIITFIFFICICETSYAEPNYYKLGEFISKGLGFKTAVFVLPESNKIITCELKKNVDDKNCVEGKRSEKLKYIEYNLSDYDQFDEAISNLSTTGAPHNIINQIEIWKKELEVENKCQFYVGGVDSILPNGYKELFGVIGKLSQTISSIPLNSCSPPPILNIKRLSVGDSKGFYQFELPAKNSGLYEFDEKSNKVIIKDKNGKPYKELEIKDNIITQTIYNACSDRIFQKKFQFIDRNGHYETVEMTGYKDIDESYFTNQKSQRNQPINWLEALALKTFGLVKDKDGDKKPNKIVLAIAKKAASKFLPKGVEFSLSEDELSMLMGQSINESGTQNLRPASYEKIAKYIIARNLNENLPISCDFSAATLSDECQKMNVKIENILDRISSRFSICLNSEGITEKGRKDCISKFTKAGPILLGFEAFDLYLDEYFPALSEIMCSSQEDESPKNCKDNTCTKEACSDELKSKYSKVMKDNFVKCYEREKLSDLFKSNEVSFKNRLQGCMLSGMLEGMNGVFDDDAKKILSKILGADSAEAQGFITSLKQNFMSCLNENQQGSIFNDKNNPDYNKLVNVDKNDFISDLFTCGNETLKEGTKDSIAIILNAKLKSHLIELLGDDLADKELNLLEKMGENREFKSCLDKGQKDGLTNPFSCISVLLKSTAPLTLNRITETIIQEKLDQFDIEPSLLDEIHLNIDDKEFSRCLDSFDNYNIEDMDSMVLSAVGCAKPYLNQYAKESVAKLLEAHPLVKKLNINFPKSLYKTSGDKVSQCLDEKLFNQEITSIEVMSKTLHSGLDTCIDQVFETILEDDIVDFVVNDQIVQITDYMVIPQQDHFSQLVTAYAKGELDKHKKRYTDKKELLEFLASDFKSDIYEFALDTILDLELNELISNKNLTEKIKSELLKDEDIKASLNLAIHGEISNEQLIDKLVRKISTNASLSVADHYGVSAAGKKIIEPNLNKCFDSINLSDINRTCHGLYSCSSDLMTKVGEILIEDTIDEFIEPLSLSQFNPAYLSMIKTNALALGKSCITNNLTCTSDLTFKNIDKGIYKCKREAIKSITNQTIDFVTADLFSSFSVAATNFANIPQLKAKIKASIDACVKQKTNSSMGHEVFQTVENCAFAATLDEYLSFADDWKKTIPAFLKVKLVVNRIDCPSVKLCSGMVKICGQPKASRFGSIYNEVEKGNQNSSEKKHDLLKIYKELKACVEI